MSMKKILTIDFDIIMAPSIELYNNKVHPNCWEEDFANNHQWRSGNSAG